jgi:hypothetical protein
MVVINLNVTDLRTKRRRSVKNLNAEDEAKELERRKGSDRRVLPTDATETVEDVQRIWLTPGERTLIEDLYLLEDKDKSE